MSTFNGSLLEIELNAELEILQDDDTLRPVHDINDIFSSSEDDDYTLFDITAEQSSHDNHNDEVWSNYFAKLHLENGRYLRESEQLLCEMKQTCSDTVELCHHETCVEHETQKQSLPSIKPTHAIATPTSTPQEEPTIITLPAESVNGSDDNDDCPGIITEHPRVVPLSAPSTHDACTAEQEHHLAHINTHEAVQSMVEEMKSFSVDESPPSPSSEPNALNTESGDNKHDDNGDYQRQLQQLEHELNQITCDHEKEMESRECVSWSILLQESKELYDEYIETTEKIKRDEQRMFVAQYFNEWKLLHQTHQRENLRLAQLAQTMRNMLQSMVNRTVIRHQTRQHRWQLWNALILKYAHRRRVHTMQCQASWKLNVVDYIVFHWRQNYHAMMHTRTIFRRQCLPLIHTMAIAYQRRRACAAKIWAWFEHRLQTRRLVQRLHAIYKLCQFRKLCIEYPIKSEIYRAWKEFVSRHRNAIEMFVERRKLQKMEQMRETMLYLRVTAKRRTCIKTIVLARNTRKRRENYLRLRRQQQMNASLTIQCYFRMCFVKRIMHEVKMHLSDIDALYSTTNDGCDGDELQVFESLDETEYILDQSIIDFDLKPLVMQQQPPEVADGMEQNASDDDEDSGDDDGSSAKTTDASSSDEECDSSDSEVKEDDDGDDSGRKEIENVSATTTQAKQSTSEQIDTGQWKFENPSVAKSWLSRQKRLNPKRKRKKSAQARLSNFQQRTQKTVGFGGHLKPTKANTAAKRTFVKFGC